MPRFLPAPSYYITSSLTVYIVCTVFLNLQRTYIQQSVLTVASADHCRPGKKTNSSFLFLYRLNDYKQNFIWYVISEYQIVQIHINCNELRMPE